MKKHTNSIFTPVFMQQAKACCMAFGVFIIYWLIPNIWQSIVAGFMPSVPEILISLLLYSYYSTIYYLPYISAISLFIHYSHLWPFVMYSVVMNILLPISFSFTLWLFDRDKNFEQFDILCASLCVILLIILIKILCKQYYNSFQNRFREYYNNKSMTKKDDVIITTLLYSFLLLLSYSLRNSV